MPLETEWDAAETEGPAQPLARLAVARRKRRDMALALPVVGAFLLASPLLNVFAGAPWLFGAPPAFVYLFGAWSLLIAATARLARRLRDDLGSE